MYALYHSLDRFVHAHWTPVVQLVLLNCVELLNLGGNYLPSLVQSQQLERLQAEQCQPIQPGLPVYNQGISAWVERWSPLSERPGQQAYGLTDVDKFAPVPSL